MHNYFCSAAIAALSIAAAQAAQAQTAALPAANAAESATAVELNAAALSEIVVTATKRETNLQDTPIAISVMSVDDLKDRHVQSLIDLADGAIPGLRVATFEARQSALTIGIRGIVPLDANQPAREQGVGVYIDGVYLGRQHGLSAALLDMDRIEVLKGPQGTLFGRNTEGGALSLVSKRPSGEFGLRTTAGVSNYGGYNGEIHLDLPEVAGFSVKLDGAAQYQGPTTKNPMPGEKGFNYFDRRGGRAAVRWRPTDSFTADLTADYSYDANTPFYSQLLNYNPLGRTVGFGSGQIAPLPPIVQVRTDRMKVADIGVPQQPSVGKNRGVALHLSWSPNDDVEIRSITAYRKLSETQWDNSGGAHRPPVFAPNGRFSRYSLADLYQHQFSQELQAVGSLQRVDYVAGLYYFTETANDDAATPSTNQWNATGTGYTILDPTPTFPGSRFVDRASIAYAKSYAAYGQATYTPDLMGDALHLTVGGRVTRDDKHGRLFTVNNAATNLTFAEKNSRFDPMVTLAVDAADGVNLYAKYATGYRSGGASSRSLTYRSFGPEEVQSYELGAKTEFLDRRVRLNVAGYVMDRSNSQIDFSALFNLGNNTSRNTLETINAPGKTKIRGLEVDTTILLTDELTLSGGYAYTYTKVPPTLNPFNNTVQPVFIVFTPRNTASIALDYARPMTGFTVKAHIDGACSQATQTFDQEAIKNDSATIFNARLSLADIDVGRGSTRLTVSAWARNLFDEDHVYRRSGANQATIGDYGNLNAPRTFGAEATVTF